MSETDIIMEQAKRFELARLDGPELQNVMQSIEAMGRAQLKRFGAAGVVTLIFDASGTHAMAIVRPDEGGITDDYILGALHQIAEQNAPAPKRKNRR